MSKEILINLNPEETQIAVVENGLLRDVHVECANKRGLRGNIFKGKVSRVLPGIQVSFVNLNSKRTGFLHISNILTSYNEENSLQQPSTSSLLQEGDELLAQVTKDPLGSKNARLTAILSIPSRYTVFNPDKPNISISNRIENETGQNRLKNIIAEYQNHFGLSSYRDEKSSSLYHILRRKNLIQDKTDTGEFIVRTATENVHQDELYKDMDFLESYGNR